MRFRICRYSTLFFISLAIMFGLTKGTFTYKDPQREVAIAIQSQDAETLSSALALITYLVSIFPAERKLGR